MFRILLFTVFIVGSIAEDGMKAAVDKCAPKFPSVDLKVLDDMCKGSGATIDKDAKCLVKCVGEESGVATADGKLVADKLKALASSKEDAATVEATIKKCTAIVKPDACETAFEQWKCICEAAKE